MWKGIRHLRGRRPETTVEGHYLPPPRPTLWALAYALLFIACPVLFVAGLFDLGLSLIVGALGGSCWGVYCLLGS